MNREAGHPPGTEQVPHTVGLRPCSGMKTRALRLLASPPLPDSLRATLRCTPWAQCRDTTGKGRWLTTWRLGYPRIFGDGAHA
jgi:hypothetical protein